jgi:hypothetical protein
MWAVGRQTNISEISDCIQSCNNMRSMRMLNGVNYIY